MSPRPLLSVTLALTGTALLTGCIDRRIFITSDPPGAEVTLNDVDVGRTPCEVDFTYFGTYEVRLCHEGYETLVTEAAADPPLHEQPGIDFLAMLVPGTRHTRIDWHFTLDPANNDPEGMIERAEAARERLAESSPSEPE